MKFHYLKTEIMIFLIILFFVVLPPCFVVNTSQTVRISFNFVWLISICGYIFYREKKTEENPQKKNFIFCFIIPVIFCTICLFSLLFFLDAVARYIDYTSVSKPIVKPEQTYMWALSIFFLALSAFSEEFVYRFYLPDMMKHLVCYKYDKKNLVIICEITACVLFALGHLYSGYLAVIFAALSHCVFRVIYKQTGNIFVTSLSHFIYNTILFIFL